MSASFNNHFKSYCDIVTNAYVYNIAEGGTVKLDFTVACTAFNNSNKLGTFYAVFGQRMFPQRVISGSSQVHGFTWGINGTDNTLTFPRLQDYDVEVQQQELFSNQHIPVSCDVSWSLDYTDTLAFVEDNPRVGCAVPISVAGTISNVSFSDDTYYSDATSYEANTHIEDTHSSGQRIVKYVLDSISGEERSFTPLPQYQSTMIAGVLPSMNSRYPLYLQWNSTTHLWSRTASSPRVTYVNQMAPYISGTYQILPKLKFLME